MKEAKFKLGDLVETNQIGICKVTDVMYSHSKDLYVYEVTNEQYGDSDWYREDSLILVPEKKEYSMEVKIDIAENVVIATLYEVANGEATAVIGKGHGHIMHDAVRRRECLRRILCV